MPILLRDYTIKGPLAINNGWATIDAVLQDSLVPLQAKIVVEINHRRSLESAGFKTLDFMLPNPNTHALSLRVCFEIYHRCPYNDVAYTHIPQTALLLLNQRRSRIIGLHFLTPTSMKLWVLVIGGLMYTRLHKCDDIVNLFWAREVAVLGRIFGRTTLRGGGSTPTPTLAPFAPVFSHILRQRLNGFKFISGTNPLATWTRYIAPHGFSMGTMRVIIKHFYKCH